MTKAQEKLVTEARAALAEMAPTANLSGEQRILVALASLAFDDLPVPPPEVLPATPLEEAQAAVVEIASHPRLSPQEKIIIALAAEVFGKPKEPAAENPAAPA